MPETSIVVDFNALEHNLRELRRMLGDVGIMAVLKANAYGLGAKQLMRELLGLGIKSFAVANFHEAMELRAVDSEASILILGYVAPENMSEAALNRLSLTVFSRDYWSMYFSRIKGIDQRNLPISVHIKIDTGFHRLGFESCAEDYDCVESICTNPMIRVESVYSHLALASEEEDKAQFEAFNSFIAEMGRRGVRFPAKHIAESISAVVYDWARLDLVRVGALLYGLKSPGYPEEYKRIDLKPTVCFRSVVSRVHTLKKGEGVSYDYTFRAPEDMRVATLAFGFADGPFRKLGNNWHVLINGKKAPLIGLMCMDQCAADIRGIDGVQIGDIVEVFDYDENSPVSIYDMAKLLGTNRSEIIARLSNRVTRIYKKDGRAQKINNLTGRDTGYLADK